MKCLFIAVLVALSTTVPAFAEHNETFVPRSINDGSTMPKCGNDRDCSYRGRCDNRTHTCICDEGYLSIAGESDGCTYEQKKQWVAFLIQFFSGYTGASNFYIEDYLLGSLKWLPFGLMIIGSCGGGCSKGAHRDAGQIGYGCLTLWSALAVGVWQIVDSVLFGLNYYKDENGRPLKKW